MDAYAAAPHIVFRVQVVNLIIKKCVVYQDCKVHLIYGLLELIGIYLLSPIYIKSTRFGT